MSKAKTFLTMALNWNDEIFVEGDVVKIEYKSENSSKPYIILVGRIDNITDEELVIDNSLYLNHKITIVRMDTIVSIVLIPNHLNGQRVTKDQRDMDVIPK